VIGSSGEKLKERAESPVESTEFRTRRGGRLLRFAMTAPPSPLLRPGRPDDVEAVLDFWRRADASPSSTESADDVRGLLERDPDALIVAESGGEIVGTLVAGWDGWRATFYRLAVDPAHRRHGLATALVRAGEERLRALGARRIGAIVESHEPGAMAFWAAAGYELQSSRSRFVKNLP
jgi:ribosomal protein S18 acetylase RimI-like enzyme